MPYDGQAHFELFYLVPEIPVKDIPVLPLPSIRCRCCSVNDNSKVFADASDPDEFKNDVNGFLWTYKDVVSSATIYLQKNGLDIATLNGNTYGDFFSFGFFESDGYKYIGYKLKWRSVLQLHGIGTYRLRIEAVSQVGNFEEFSNTFILAVFTPQRVDGTVKFEFFNNYLKGLNSDDQRIFDFGNLDWYDSIRVKGMFGFPISNYEREYVQYSNGSQEWVRDQQTPEYTFKSFMLPAFQHDILRTEMFQSDTILVTDYNSSNPNKFIQKSVKPNSEYAPKWSMRGQTAPVELKFIQSTNNLRKSRC